MSAIDVHAVVEGPADAPAVVLSSSLGTTTAVWDRQVAELARRFRVIRYDLRGHGSSPVPPGPYDISDLGADIVALLDRLGVERADLAGLSIGGMASMWVAAFAPGRRPGQEEGRGEQHEAGGRGGARRLFHTTSGRPGTGPP